MTTAAMEPALDCTRARVWNRGRYYVLGLLALIGLLNTIDQSILAVTSPGIQLEFHLSDGQVGLLSGAFVVVYALAVLPSGYWVDRFNRPAIIALGVAAWSLCTLLTGFAQTYAQLFIARAALGIGESTTVPAGVSLLGDHFAKAERGRAAGVLQAALQVGLAVGLIAGAIIAARLGWRAAFFLAAVPGLVLAALAFTMREPPRGAAEPLAPRPRALALASPRAFVRLLQIRSLVAGVIANAFIVFATTGIGAFVALYLTRYFGLELAQVGAMVGGPLLVSGVVGNTVGGWLVDWRGRSSARAPLELATVCSLVAAAGLVATFSARTPATFVVAFFMSTLAGNVAIPGLLAINQNLVVPPLRGSATAMQQLSANLAGRALGVLLIGLVADQLHDLRLALTLLPSAALVLSALAAASGLSSMPADLAAMEEEWEHAPTTPARRGAS